MKSPWPVGWQVIEPGEGAGLEGELGRELKHGHPLFDIPVAAIARRLDRDDVLFELRDGSGRIADVHLTWAGGGEPPPWPSTSIFKTLDDWLESAQ